MKHGYGFSAQGLKSGPGSKPYRGFMSFGFGSNIDGRSAQPPKDGHAAVPHLLLGARPPVRWYILGPGTGYLKPEARSSSKGVRSL